MRLPASSCFSLRPVHEKDCGVGVGRGNTSRWYLCHRWSREDVFPSRCVASSMATDCWWRMSRMSVLSVGPRRVSGVSGGKA